MLSLRNALSAFVLAVAVFATGCSHLPDDLDLSPKGIVDHAVTIGLEAGGPVKLAQDDRFTLRDIPADASEAINLATRDIEATGRRLTPSPSPRLITLGRYVVLPADWSTRTPSQQAIGLLHERCHALWQDHLGIATFDALYPVASWRWGLEAVCYRQTVVADVHLTGKPAADAVRDATAHLFSPANLLAGIEHEYRHITPPILAGVLSHPNEKDVE